MNGLAGVGLSTGSTFAQRVVNFCVSYLGAWFDSLGINKNKLEKDNLEKNIGATYKEIITLEQNSHELEQPVQWGGVNVPSISRKSPTGNQNQAGACSVSS
jgi:methionine salvage enolase-phosphatase E1